jgi:hypothetical protein
MYILHWWDDGEVVDVGLQTCNAVWTCLLILPFLMNPLPPPLRLNWAKSVRPFDMYKSANLCHSFFQSLMMETDSVVETSQLYSTLRGLIVRDFLTTFNIFWSNLYFMSFVSKVIVRVESRDTVGSSAVSVTFLSASAVCSHLPVACDSRLCVSDITDTWHTIPKL